jgi:biotin operon repressor
MDDIKGSIRATLPSLSEEALNRLIQKLEDDGVESIDDCRHVVESDLKDFLKPIQIRKLLEQWISGK